MKPCHFLINFWEGSIFLEKKKKKKKEKKGVATFCFVQELVQPCCLGMKIVTEMNERKKRTNKRKVDKRTDGKMNDTEYGKKRRSILKRAPYLTKQSNTTYT